MEKAYAISDLVTRLKGHGLDVAEEAAKAVVEETCKWVAESAALSENKVDDLVALGLPQLQSLLMGLADKIDGKVG